MKIVFAGTPEFSVPTLRRLVEDGHELALVLTQPDRPSGRGRHLHPSAVKTFAIEHHLPVLQPEDINLPESVGAVRYVAPDVMVVKAFGQKLSPEMLSVPRLGCLNVHASLLPAYRGAAPINHAILRGEDQTGVTIIRMNERIDAGEVLAQKVVRIEPEWTAGNLSDALSAAGAELMTITLQQVESGAAKPIPQDVSKVSKAPRLEKDDGLIPWHKSARDVHNHIRGMTPWPGAFTFLPVASRDDVPRTVRVTVLKGSVAAGSPGAAPGTVTASDRTGVVVACGEGAVRLERVKPSGGREMPAGDFARGHAVVPGMRFVSHE